MQARFISNTVKSLRLNDLWLWQGRLVIWGAAVLATWVLVLFNRLVDHTIAGFESLHTSHPWTPWLLAPLGGMLIVYLVNRFFPGSHGSGIPQVIVAQHAAGDISRLASIRIAIGKIFLGTAALGCGFSAGREGPSVQIAASLMQACERFMPRRFPVTRSDFLLAGGAVGIAAAFNTPVAGIIFAIEELGRRFEARTNGVLLTAIVFAGIISISLQGNYNYFGHLRVPNSSPDLVVPVLLLGIIGGIGGGLFSRLLLIGTGPWSGALGRFKREHPVLLAGICGLLVAALGMLSHGQTFGSGYIATQHSLQTGSTLPPEFPLLKYLATLVSYIAGIPGGIFAPSLSVGAGLGQTFATWHLFNLDLNMTACMLIGMSAFMSGVTQAPMTSFIIVAEMTDGHPVVLSLMAASILASLLARAISPPLYHTMAKRMIIAGKITIKAHH